MAGLGVQLAHVDGGVPNIRIEVEISESVIGGLLYFFEKAPRHRRLYAGRQSLRPAGRSRLYKNMFALDKPGYEEAESHRAHL